MTTCLYHIITAGGISYNCSKIKTAERVSTVRERIKTEERIKITNMNDLESDDESVDTPLVSPFPHSDNDSDDGEVLNELIEYENVGMLSREKAINSFDGDDLAF
ncbi:hypothetical protein Tco_0842248 [Tanacetum coccineum]|uniref:Uncharacterized protein n=1 Tax=Tanacetum coccineum TaxID=301880 RepID=A0ABQ5B2W5_9ASTR